MEELPQGVTEGPIEKPFTRFVLLFFAASLVASAVLHFSNQRGWTHIALWVPPALAVGMPAYALAFGEWLRWGERRRAGGRSTLSGVRWHVGSTPGSDALVFGTVLTALASLISGALSDHLLEGALLLWLLPAIWSFVPLLGTRGENAIISCVLGGIGFALLNMAPAQARRHGLDAATTLVALLFFVVGACLLMLMVWWQAHGAWLAEQQTESKAP
jgi:hypothetical protein